MPATGARPTPGARPGGIIRLSRVSLFEGISPQRLRRLDARLPVVRWIYGTARPPELVALGCLFVVREGRMALFEPTASGSQVMIAVIDPGAIYTTLGTQRPPRVDALEDVAVSAIPGSILEALAIAEPRLVRNMAEAFSERTEMLRETAAVLAEMRVEDRLRARVLQLAERFGAATPVGERLSLGLTHAQWGLLVGAARESVTLAFGRLRARGELMMEGRTITVPWETVRARPPAP